MNIYEQRIASLRAKMKEEGVAAYLILTGDPHNSETPLPYYGAERKFFCPFSGDNAYLLISQEAALLWTDGRFFISARQELSGTEIALMEMDSPGVPSLKEYLASHDLFPLATSFLIAPVGFIESINQLGEVRDLSFSYLVSDKPELPRDPLFELALPFSGQSAESKIKKVKEQLGQAQAVLISTLDDIAYLTNLRGHDIPYAPLFHSYLYLGEENVLFVDPVRVPDAYSATLVKPLEELLPYLESVKDVPTLLDPVNLNAKLYGLFSSPVNGPSPSRLMKAVKNTVEIQNTIKTQIKDGTAVVRFQMELEKRLKEKGVTDEWSLGLYLHKCRQSNEGFIEESFENIVSVGSNAAMMHYAPSEDKYSLVSAEAVSLLLDSGGTYFGGTTDTTRTFPIKPNAEFVHDYTLTLKSLIALSRAVFIAGSNGRCLDGLAREVMWREGLDYKCGTGHGVGYMNVVHEGPNAFRYKDAGRHDGANIVPGMITTVEPGVYKEGKYGIRIENNLLCVRAFENEFGTFYKFETITYVPIETSCLDLALLSQEEKDWLNAYHAEVKEKLSPLLNEEEREYLAKKTQAI